MKLVARSIWRLPAPLGQVRAVPMRTRAGDALLFAYARDFTIDPSPAMFFLPTGTLRLAVGTCDGALAWQVDLGPGVIPGNWFCPVLPFDLDGDGNDEIWCVGNEDAQHPLGWHGLGLERRDPQNGALTGRWPWPFPDETDRQPMYAAYRHFLLAGHVRGEPVLVCGEGTYMTMRLVAFDPGMARRWEWEFQRPAQTGPRGSHQSPVCDLDGDGVDELVWGERIIRLDTGREMVCCDADSYNGHSDLVQPVWHEDTGAWTLFTLRENDPGATPRAVCFDARGARIWGALDHGHMDQGWVARIGPGGLKQAWALRVGGKQAGPDGIVRERTEEFLWNVVDGTPAQPVTSFLGTLPVDLDGAGRHRLVRGLTGTQGDGAVIDPLRPASDAIVARVPGQSVLACKLFGWPGEQVVAFLPDGAVTAWASDAAADTPAAIRRYAHPFYAANTRLAGVGYNLVNLGGL